MEQNTRLLKMVRIMADNQFGKGCGANLFPDDVTFKLSRTKRVRQILHQEKRIATIRARDGMFTLSMDAVNVLHRIIPIPGKRVAVCDDAAPFVSKGKTAFAKHVIDIDPDLRAGDEVIVVDREDKALATGQLLLSPDEVQAMDTGAAVDIRHGWEQ